MTKYLKLISAIAALLLAASCGSTKNARKSLSGNPVFPGWYADPEGAVFGKEYWIFPTLSDLYAAPDEEMPAYPAEKSSAVHQLYNIQTYMDAFSSKDLVNWTKHPKVLTTDAVKWVKYAMWAPAILEHKGKYYLFFSGNDIQNDHEYGGIGVAVADRPGGPYKDALGKPLIDRIVNGAQPIDQFVFRDDDGTHYMYYGGWHHCNMVKLSDDLLSVVPFDDGETYKSVTPENYVEGPFMFKRGGKYYFMRSEGGSPPLGDTDSRQGRILHRLPPPPAGRDRHGAPPDLHRPHGVRCRRLHQTRKNDFRRGQTRPDQITTT